MPPPKHGPRSKPVSVTAPATEVERTEEPQVTIDVATDPAPVAAAAAPAAPPAPQAPAQAAPSKPSTATSRQDDLTARTIYLDDDNDDFLEEAKRSGRREKPRVDATRSAVVRLALARLRDQMTPEQVVRELAARAAPHVGTGRRRL
ncbi:hypothetical protein [Rhodococcus sp. NPDC058481]|uniref:hypothetical protein n=1 Tax=unclassified Rhodococcus (in: high G+C Gram-positive bacteria) TaxID=192944 RepID=UPI00366A4E67